MKPKVGDEVRINGSKDVYEVCGVAGDRLWLSIVDDGYYDGYNGDLIVQETESGYAVVLSDDRCRYHGSVRLTPAE